MSNLTSANWKAWIDLQPIQPIPGGTLHVTGEIDTHNTNEAKLQKPSTTGF
ncbi:MAG: hypothetical protein JWN56_1496 [Sphingobacteriales bacterium]|nr:hypothetical protein [Sphingobacteriales bacterium]